MMPQSTDTLIAVDIGNSRIKLGRFDRAARSRELREPTATLELRFSNQAGDFDAERLATWCRDEVLGDAAWLTSSVHRGGAERLGNPTAALGPQNAQRRAW